MKVMVNIEYPIGVTDKDIYINWIVGILGVEKKDVSLIQKYNGSYFWLLKDINKEKYDSELNAISSMMTKAHTKGMIQYFFIGEVD